MSLKPSRVRLIVPGCRTFSRGTEKPQSIRCRPIPFTVDRALGEPDIRISGLLIKIPLLRGFKTTRTLEDHILNAANIIEIQAIPQYPVHADVTNHQHAKISFPFGFSPHQTSEQPGLLRVRLDNSQVPTSLYD